MRHVVPFSYHGNADISCPLYCLQYNLQPLQNMKQLWCHQ